MKLAQEWKKLERSAPDEGFKNPQFSKISPFDKIVNLISATASSLNRQNEILADTIELKAKKRMDKVFQP